MTTSAITTSAIRPYLAPVLLQVDPKIRVADVMPELVKASERTINADAKCKDLATSALPKAHRMTLSLLVYRQEAHPSWLIGPSLVDARHEIVILASRGRYAAVVASDGAVRDRIVGSLAGITLLSRERMETFIGDDASVLYLNGVHVPTPVKPNGKILTGNSIEFALDPLGDQSYLLSAARTQPSVLGLSAKSKRPPSVGTSPMESRLWVGRQKDWEEFTANLSAILEHARSAKSSPGRFAMLAYPVSDVSLLGDAYALSVVPRELLSEDSVSSQDYEFARRWAYDAAFVVTGGAKADFEVDCSMLGGTIGRARVAVNFKAKGMVEFKPTWVGPAPPTHKDAKSCLSLLGNTQMVKVHYDSGHAIAQGRCYASTPTDQRFNYEFVRFNGYITTQEKPSVVGSTLAAEIGSKSDKSLFAFVLQKIFVDAAGKPVGWLACDDGSMELADFVHIDEATNTVTLVHVKASGSKLTNRQVSVSDYEIVVGQTVKNVRHLHQQNIHQGLQAGKGKKIGSAVWKDGVKQADRVGFLAAVKKLPSHHERVAMIVQPRLTRKEHDHCLTAGKSVRLLRFQQLNTLLLAARQSVQSCGASLRVICEDI
ncbi:hypothetical protein [Stenotrophomonas sp. SORGH_AS_0321]|uniref:hypothetical protein n=1 Tax=Stenotrophomonas sp. SORGH_AS_0321 TaxID=3041787 RepID=UPI002856EFB5|nr:hypothetical protein [Stenotrophomonas sp. SORGH_AS_0321]MDR6092932.1 hypothetical protein [Stenotrophomonas sp. SORGH_AS_0321]